MHCKYFCECCRKVRVTGTAEVSGGDADMRMLRHSCQLEKWSGRRGLSLLQVLLALFSIYQLLSPIFSHIPFPSGVVVTSLTVPIEMLFPWKGT